MISINLNVENDVVFVQLPTPTGDIQTEYVEKIRKGQLWNDLTYEELVLLGSGQHLVEV